MNSTSYYNIKMGVQTLGFEGINYKIYDWMRDDVEYACFLDSCQKRGKCIGAKHLFKG